MKLCRDADNLRLARPLGLLILLLFPLHLDVIAASRFQLALPLDCSVGTDCHIQNLFDHQTGPDFQDYACGRLGYDGHDGTDLRLANLRHMKRGVAVLAAADGRVRAVRDAMPDISIREPGQLRAVQDREAGNAVAIDHGNGWETQYSHMQRGSIAVTPGQLVQAGDKLGLVGLSGKTEFPHLHFEVRYQGKPVDPFTGIEGRVTCGPGDHALWDDAALAALAYRSTNLLQAGFTATRPKLSSVEAGQYQGVQFAPDAPALAFWVEVFGVHEGDVETIRLELPDGSALAEKTVTLPYNKAQWVTYIGKKRRNAPWTRGTYRGYYKLVGEREGEVSTILEVRREMTVR